MHLPLFGVHQNDAAIAAAIVGRVILTFSTGGALIKLPMSAEVMTFKLTLLC
jgi:hypothetical protein